MVLAIVKCKDYKDVLKAIEIDYKGHVVYVDWVKNLVYLNCAEADSIEKQQVAKAIQ